jgi:transketolase N-terminal domain/subunit
MAAIGVALWKYVMRYAPHTPDYFNRDRFVLSNGNLLEIIFQQAKTLTITRPHMSFSIHVPPSHRLQSHDARSAEIVPLRPG